MAVQWNRDRQEADRRENALSNDWDSSRHMSNQPSLLLEGSGLDYFQVGGEASEIDLASGYQGDGGVEAAA